MSRWIAVLASVALACAACGGESPSVPTAPSNGLTGPAAGSVTQGARIMGNVSAGETLAAMAAQVVGTTISSPVGPGGGFVLDGVPAGPVQMRFVGSGVDASVSLSPVQPGDLVSVLVGVSAASASVQSESRNAGGKVELEGRVESTVPADLAFTVAGRLVKTLPGTVFRDANGGPKTYTDLAIGQRVHVKGTLATDAVNADLVTIQNTNTWIPVNVNGIVETLNTSTPPAGSTFSFLIGSREIRGDGDTRFFGDGDVLLTLAALKDGSRVEVKGELRDGWVYALRIHINEPTVPEPPQEDSASVEGIVSALAGTAPALTMKIGATAVATDGQTVVQRRGDVQTLAAIANGQIVHAVGVRQPDGSLLARKLQIKDDGPDGPFVIEGSLGGLKGACPAVTFGVNGYVVKTDGATTYFPDTPAPGLTCAALKSGIKVEVAGMRQADGIVLAEKITKK
jgi:hypothetical protein